MFPKLIKFDSMNLFINWLPVFEFSRCLYGLSFIKICNCLVLCFLSYTLYASIDKLFFTPKNFPESPNPWFLTAILFFVYIEFYNSILFDLIATFLLMTIYVIYFTHVF